MIWSGRLSAAVSEALSIRLSAAASILLSAAVSVALSESSSIFSSRRNKFPGREELRKIFFAPPLKQKRLNSFQTQRCKISIFVSKTIKNGWTAERPTDLASGVLEEAELAWEVREISEEHLAIVSKTATPGFLSKLYSTNSDLDTVQVVAQ